MRRIGFVVNPVAGMGGRVGLKGTDGKVEEARELGAERRAPDRGRDALRSLDTTDAEVELLTYGGAMGEREARDAGFAPRVVGRPDGDETTAADTRAAVRAFLAAGVDLVLFTGGDGTAVDVAETLSEEGGETPILGVPAGVKVYSAVFGVDPEAAGYVAGTFEGTEQAEVNDIDEDQYRDGEVHTELRAVANVPTDERRQSVLDSLDETLFTSWSIDRMVAASREIEDRAWRVGDGTLHAGFQTLSTLRGELDRYERLSQSPIDVHTYATPDAEPPDERPFQLHLDRSDELAESWFVVFDGGSAAAGDGVTQKCALLAEERGPRNFYGFWTYDASTVDYIIDYLRTRYGKLEQ